MTDKEYKIGGWVLALSLKKINHWRIKQKGSKVKLNKLPKPKLNLKKHVQQTSDKKIPRKSFRKIRRDKKRK